MTRFDKIVVALWLLMLPQSFLMDAAGIERNGVGPWWLNLGLGLIAAVLAYRMAARIWRYMPSREQCERGAAMDRRP